MVAIVDYQQMLFVCHVYSYATVTFLYFLNSCVLVALTLTGLLWYRVSLYPSVLPVNAINVDFTYDYFNWLVITL